MPAIQYPLGPALDAIVYNLGGPNAGGRGQGPFPLVNVVYHYRTGGQIITPAFALDKLSGAFQPREQSILLGQHDISLKSLWAGLGQALPSVVDEQLEAHMDEMRDFLDQHRQFRDKLGRISVTQLLGYEYAYHPDDERGGIQYCGGTYAGVDWTLHLQVAAVGMAH